MARRLLLVTAVGLAGCGGETLSISQDDHGKRLPYANCVMGNRPLFRACARVVGKRVTMRELGIDPQRAFTLRFPKTARVVLRYLRRDAHGRLVQVRAAPVQCVDSDCVAQLDVPSHYAPAPANDIDLLRLVVFGLGPKDAGVTDLVLR